MVKTADYWKERFEQLNESLLQIGEIQCEEVEKQFRLALKSLEKDLTLWYKWLAVSNKISYADAKKLLAADELEEFHWTVKDYIKKGKENNIAQQWTKQLENASAKVHISRLDALKLQIQNQFESLYGKQLDGLNKAVEDIYSKAFYHTAFEVDKGTGVGTQLNRLDIDKVKTFINKPWAADGKNFSDRVWNNKNKLVNILQTEMTQATIRGDPLDRIVKNFAKKMNSSKSAAARIVMTESAFFSSAGQMEAFKNLDVEKYQFIATLDRRTSEICRNMDNKIFKLSDYEPGVNAPPLHCWCRSCTVPYFEDDTDSKRAARSGNGKTYTVPADMSYTDWKTTYIDKTKNSLQKNDFQLKANVDNGKISLKLKDYGNAVIPIAKLTEYALNPKKDNNKAAAFEQALGYNIDNVDKLINNIKININKFDIVQNPDNGYGERFHILMNLLGENGKSADVLSAWIKDARNGEVRLTSIYVKRRNKKHDT